VITGPSNVNALRLVPTTAATVSSSDAFIAGMPKSDEPPKFPTFCAMHATYVFVVQEVEWHPPVVWSSNEAVGVTMPLPKLMPSSVIVLPCDDGKLSRRRFEMIGASKVNPVILHPTKALTLTFTAVGAAMIKLRFRHFTVVSETHIVETQLVIPP
jgi:hypothetical protein